MAESTIPVDLRNPGQVFACLGLMEAAAYLGGSPVARFDTAAERFSLKTEMSINPVQGVLEFLHDCDLWVEIPEGSKVPDNSKQNTRSSPAAFAFAREQKGDRLPVCLEKDGIRVLITNWGDSDTGRELIKFWGGAAGFSGAGRLAGQLKSLQALSTHDLAAQIEDPFSFCDPETKTPFRLDARSGYTPFDNGWSLDQHNKYQLPKYPFVEILAVMGLENARPTRNNSRLSYSYNAWSDWLPLPLARAALGGADFGFSLQRYTITLAEPNDYDRVIVEITQE